MKLSFCTTCSNRLYQLEDTFDANLELIVAHPDTEWVIVNFNSKDDLHDFMMRRMAALPARVTYARALADPSWHASLAKNTAHNLASGDILVNLDCDNYISDAIDVIHTHFKPEIQALHLWSGVFGDGTCGRIAMRRDAFHKLGGYDEAFLPVVHEDMDLLKRTRAKGMTVRHIPFTGMLPIQNSREDSIKYGSPEGRDWKAFLLENTSRSNANIANNRLTANAGKKWGELELEIFHGKG
jgi:predicted glycosyltransferase involved in capsule biosynthesis